MSTITGNPPAQVKQPDAADREVIEDLHDMGRLFQSAVGEHLANKAGTAEITPEEQAYTLDIITNLSGLSGNTELTKDEVSNKEMFFGTCLHSTCAEAGVRSLEKLNVPFEVVADKVSIDTSNIAAVERKLAVCEKYGFKAFAALLKHKLAP